MARIPFAPFSFQRFTFQELCRREEWSEGDERHGRWDGIATREECLAVEHRGSDRDTTRSQRSDPGTTACDGQPVGRSYPRTPMTERNEIGDGCTTNKCKDDTQSTDIGIWLVKFERSAADNLVVNADIDPIRPDTQSG